MIGAIAGDTVGPDILHKVKEHLPSDLWQITEQFCRTFGMEETIPSLDTCR